MSASANPAKASESDFEDLVPFVKALGAVDSEANHWGCEEEGYLDCMLFETRVPWETVRAMCHSLGTPTMRATLGLHTGAAAPDVCYTKVGHETRVTVGGGAAPSSVPRKFFRLSSGAYMVGHAYLEGQQQGVVRCTSTAHDGEPCSMATCGKCVWQRPTILAPAEYAAIQRMALELGAKRKLLSLH